MTQFIKIHPDDNVSVAISNTDNIPAGHKMALKDMKAGENVIKYGFPIGYLTEDIRKGQLIDHRNLKTNLEGTLEYSYNPSSKKESPATSNDKATFMGYRRSSGRAGIRNEIWILPTVGCINGTVRKLEEKFKSVLHNYPQIEKVIAFTHPYGCSQLGDDHKNTQKILASMVHHPNAAGVLIVGLGCENNQISDLKELIGPVDTSKIKFLETQKVSGDEIDYGLELLCEIASASSSDHREEISVSELNIGLKCGGSDGFSGITANPLLGRFSDWIIANGGSAILTEVPEMFGAETILMDRCKDRDTFDKTVSLINDFKKYFIDNHQPVYENPSPGNKEGGISTLEEKSLGCTQKSGNSEVTDVLAYGDMIRTKGLNLLSAPGNDLVASTALAAAGCQIVLFTTGRGTPFGTCVPTIKISTNSTLAKAKPGWIDFNAGTLLEGTPTSEIDKAFREEILALASGKLSANEKAGCSEIAIFKSGVTL